MTSLKEVIEAIFNPNNINNDCDTSASKMHEYEKMMKSHIVSGRISTAVTIFREVVESIAYHYLKDEHHNYFDYMYRP